MKSKTSPSTKTPLPTRVDFSSYMSIKLKAGQKVVLFDNSEVIITKVLENGNFMVGNRIYSLEKLKKLDKKESQSN